MIEYIKFQLKWNWNLKRVYAWIKKFRDFNSGINRECIELYPKDAQGRRSDTVIFKRGGDICIQVNGQWLLTTDIDIRQVVEFVPKITVTFIPTNLKFDDNVELQYTTEVNRGIY